MTRTYKVIDADGHILEPVDIWDTYMDPAYRERAPRLIIGDNGKERLLIEGQILGNPKGLGRLGAVGSRDGSVDPDKMMYKDGRPGGFDPHARIKDMELDGIDAAFLYPSIGLFSGAVKDPKLAAAMCRAYNRWLTDYCKPYPDRLFGIAMLPMQSIDLAIDEMRFARKTLGCGAASSGPTPTTTAWPVIPTTTRSGPRPRSWTSRSASTRAPRAGCPPSASIGSTAAAPGTSSRTRWR